MKGKSVYGVDDRGVTRQMRGETTEESSFRIMSVNDVVPAASNNRHQLDGRQQISQWRQLLPKAQNRDEAHSSSNDLVLERAVGSACELGDISPRPHITHVQKRIYPGAAPDRQRMNVQDSPGLFHLIATGSLLDFGILPLYKNHEEAHQKKYHH